MVDNPSSLPQNISVIGAITERILSRGGVTSEGHVSMEEALFLAGSRGPAIFALFAGANRLREAFRGNRVDLCSIINAKSGGCAEDCSYCAQSSRSQAGIKTYPLMGGEEILRAALRARDYGARRFCIVTGGRRPGRRELEGIARAVGLVRDAGLLPCATLGLLEAADLKLLRDAGLERYHHNLETSARFFPEVCGTHSYDDKLRTIRAAKETGLSVCCGGIFGLGEQWQDRVEMAFQIRELAADSVPLNFLIPVAGTPLGGLTMLSPFEALKIISLYRFLLPEKEIRVCGGRPQCLGEFNDFVFRAGADGLLIGDYLTEKGSSLEADLRLIREQGLEAG
ncbi:MAG: biotin synthase BioB [Nitrospiraceae bacterium]|nr:biotin synthase BioB [Nitrospiraceae bacterium]